MKRFSLTTDLCSSCVVINSTDMHKHMILLPSYNLRRFLYKYHYNLLKGAKVKIFGHQQCLLLKIIITDGSKIYCRISFDSPFDLCHFSLFLHCAFSPPFFSFHFSSFYHPHSPKIGVMMNQNPCHPLSSSQRGFLNNDKAKFILTNILIHPSKQSLYV